MPDALAFRVALLSFGAHASRFLRGGAPVLRIAAQFLSAGALLFSPFPDRFFF